MLMDREDKEDIANSQNVFESTVDDTRVALLSGLNLQ